MPEDQELDQEEIRSATREWVDAYHDERRATECARVAANDRDQKRIVLEELRKKLSEAAGVRYCDNLAAFLYVVYKTEKNMPVVVKVERDTVTLTPGIDA